MIHVFINITYSKFVGIHVCYSISIYMQPIHWYTANNYTMHITVTSVKCFQYITLIMIYIMLNTEVLVQCVGINHPVQNGHWLKVNYWSKSSKPWQLFLNNVFSTCLNSYFLRKQLNKFSKLQNSWEIKSCRYSNALCIPIYSLWNDLRGERSVGL